MMTPRTICLLITTLAFLPSCSLPPVRLSTPDPVKVDINVRLDVYQHSDSANAQPTSTETLNENLELEKRRRNRMGDIQLFKNSRLIGENHLGLLTILEKPPAEYGTYVESVVEAENKDRLELMSALAKQEKKSLEVVQKEHSELWNKRAFNGEWIEVPTGDSSSSFKWIQKGTTTEAPASTPAPTTEPTPPPTPEPTPTPDA